MSTVSRAETYASLMEHFARYFDASDRADLDEVLRILDSATVVAGPVTTGDPDLIRAAYAARHPKPGPDGRRAVKNHASNLVVSGPDADGVWTATVYYVRLEPGDTGILATASGRIEERLVPDGDDWQVLQHTILSDF